MYVTDVDQHNTYMYVCLLSFVMFMTHVNQHNTYM